MRIRAGQGVITINKRPFAEYFPSATHQMLVSEPLKVTNTAGSVKQHVQPMRVPRAPPPVIKERLSPDPGLSRVDSVTGRRDRSLPVRDLIEDKHVNSDTPNVITFYLRTDAWDRQSRQWKPRVPEVNGLYFEVSAVEGAVTALRNAAKGDDLQLGLSLVDGECGSHGGLDEPVANPVEPGIQVETGRRERAPVSGDGSATRAPPDVVERPGNRHDPVTTDPPIGRL